MTYFHDLESVMMTRGQSVSLMTRNSLTRPPHHAWTHVVIVVDLHHGRIDAGAEALDLRKREHVVFRRFSDVDLQVLFDRLHDLVRPSKPARGRSANLDVVFANRIPGFENHFTQNWIYVYYTIV